MSICQSEQFFADLSFSDADWEIARPLVNEISNRLQFLVKVGVGYLTLDRPAETLSGGELQRVRLATSIGSGLVGVCYILDEPSIGLHQRDNQRLIESLRELQSLGNTVLVVEHDEAMMRQADQLIDMGPGAGDRGGFLVAQGTPDEISGDADSSTGHYLSGKEEIPVPSKRRRTAKTRSVTIEGARINNLKNVTARVPLNALVCVTGVSGSGKSSLINETFAPALLRRLGAVAAKPGQHKRPAEEQRRSTRSCRSINRRLAGLHVVIRQPTRACLTRFVRSLLERARPSSAASESGGLASMSKAVAVKHAKVRAFKRSR